MMFELMAMALASVSPQQAKPITMGTGNDVLVTCTSAESHDRYGCLLWSAGVTQGGLFATAELGRCLFAISPSVQGQQVIDVIVAYLRAHPETRHQPGAVLALKALRDAFPCPK